jgi:RNA polymerase sigma factor (sigma-70 family)
VYIGVAKNILARYRRRATKERAILAGLLAEALRTGDGRGRRAPGGGRYEDGRLPASRGQTVAQVLATLPAEEAKLLRLRFLEGLRVAEVARRIGCTRAAAYKRLQRIIHRLRQRYGVEPPATKKPRE